MRMRVLVLRMRVVKIQYGMARDRTGSTASTPAFRSRALSIMSLARSASPATASTCVHRPPRSLQGGRPQNCLHGGAQESESTGGGHAGERWWGVNGAPRPPSQEPSPFRHRTFKLARLKHKTGVQYPCCLCRVGYCAAWDPTARSCKTREQQERTERIVHRCAAPERNPPSMQCVHLVSSSERECERACVR